MVEIVARQAAGGLLPGVVLAAGASSRMGSPKALLEYRGQTFLAHVVSTLRVAGLEDVVVVTGAHDHEIRSAATADPALSGVRFCHNPDHARGPLSSLHLALALVDHPGVSGVVVALVDHPAVRPDTVDALLREWRATKAPVVRPRYRGRHGHPVVFDRTAFGALWQAPLDEGARAVVRGFGSAVCTVEVDDRGVVLDIDSPSDLAALTGQGDVG